MYIAFLILYGILFIFGFITTVIRKTDYGRRLIALLPVLSSLGYNELAKKCQHHADKYRNYHPKHFDTEGWKDAIEIKKDIYKIKINKDNEKYTLVSRYQLIIKLYRLGIFSIFLGYGFFILSGIFMFISQTGG